MQSLVTAAILIGTVFTFAALVSLSPRRPSATGLGLRMAALLLATGAAVALQGSGHAALLGASPLVAAPLADKG